MLRRLLVPVIYNPQFFIQDKLDEAVLRAAHRALVRQKSGITDAFLFVLCGELALEEATTAIAPYGFPDVSVICISTKDEDGEEIDDGDVREQIGFAISHWLEEHHPAAITSISLDGYDSLDMWWSGVDSKGCKANFLTEYASTLPDTHQKKVGTWLEILAIILGFECTLKAYDNQLALYAATLCEWLHGFEAASGNFYNRFEAYEVCKALRINGYDIQEFLMGQGDSYECLDEILCDDESDDFDDFEDNEDNEDIISESLKQATSNERSSLRDMLSKYFGSDTALLWALHTAIWPRYDEPAADLCNNLVNPSAWDDIAEIDDAWQFVTNGWTDSADE